MVNSKMSYSSSTRFLAAHLTVIILTVIVVGIIFAVACAAVAFEIAEPMAINAQAIEELRMKSKLKAVQGSNPQKTLDAYIEAKGRKVGVDDAATYPPHPSFRDMMNLTVEGNTWNVPSEVKERNTRFSGGPDEVSSLHVPQHQLARMTEAPSSSVDKYFDALKGRKLKQRILKLRESLVTDRDKEIFHTIFGTDEIYRHGPDIPQNLAEANDVDLLAYQSAGRCKDPMPAREGVTCAKLCYSSKAVKLQTPFVAGGHFVSHEKGEEPITYCWSGQSAGIDNDTSVEEEEKKKGQETVKKCSAQTGLLILTNDGGWQCRPKYSSFFGGPHGTTITACQFNPSSHKDYPSSDIAYYDVKKDLVIKTHEDFKNSSYLSLLRSAVSVTDFKAMSRDPEFLFNNPITCHCSDKKDVLNNSLLSADVTKRMKFRGMYECLENPCVMTPDIDPSFVTFNPDTGMCVPGENIPSGTMHAIVGDERTPLVGTVPAMGLLLADQEKRGDKVHLERPEVLNPTEIMAKKITRAAAPIITPKNLNATNTSKNVLYVPIPSVVLPPEENLGRLELNVSSVLHRSCMPPILNRVGNGGPFCTATFYIEPAANVLVGNVPQKPYEHNMLAVECLRNSRMVSGSVHGGSELLYSALLSQDSGSSNTLETEGDRRLEEIREFFNTNFNGGRRLSHAEYLILKHKLGETDDQIMASRRSRFSVWDREFKRADFTETNFKSMDHSFVLKEGLLLRSYGPYTAAVLSPSLFDLSYMQGKTSLTPSALKTFNPLQLAIPTSHSILPEAGSSTDIFSVDSSRIFDSSVMPRYFDVSNINTSSEKLFPASGSLSHYRVNLDDAAWGLQTFRLDHNPRNGPAIQSDPRLSFDARRINSTPSGATLTPLSLFKKSLVEWGHSDCDVQGSGWFRHSLDTSTAYRRMLVETAMAIRNTWFSLTWEGNDYYFVKNV